MTTALVPTFQPVAVESPGGGRIRDKRDPSSRDLVTVQGLNKRVLLHRLAAQAWAAMVNAARADGIADPLLLPVSGYRSGTLQERLWKQAQVRYGSDEDARKWVAPPGSSAHQSGRAIDFNLGSHNDSRNVAQQRRTHVHAWLLANAGRFGFYPYAREPWHWEYNPPASTPRPPAVVAHKPGSPTLRAGRRDLPTAPVLAGHRGRGPALTLRWNDMAAPPAKVDVVVHLHGYSRAWLDLSTDIEPYSGLDLAPLDGARGSGRSRPTLTLLPRGRFTGTKQTRGPLYIYTFPALDGTDGRRDGLARLIRFALDQFAAAVGGSVPRVSRLILTAHSGGGAPLLRMLRWHDPHEVHVFDALYWDAAPLADWARRHIRGDRAAVAGAGAVAPRAYMAAHGGALRVFHGAGTRAYSRRLLELIKPELAAGLDDFYRVEASSFGHWEIPRNYGWRMLADVSADVPRATRVLSSARPSATVRELKDIEGHEAGGPAPAASQFTRITPGLTRMARLLPLLEKYRGEIPLEFLLGWIDVESAGRVDVTTSLDERGFFQIHPAESHDRHFDHQRLTTDPDYSVQAGIENVRYYARLARQRFASIPAGSELFWRVVKLQHAMGSGLARKLLNALAATRAPLTWEAIRQFEVTRGPQLHRLLRVKPLGRFTRNVDHVFARGSEIAGALRATPAEMQASAGRHAPTAGVLELGRS
jgi:hypothetical protein